MPPPSSLHRDISPPPTRKSSVAPERREIPTVPSNAATTKSSVTVDQDLNPSLAAIEAGEAQVRDHLAYFAKHLSAAKRPSPGPSISITDFQKLYKRNLDPNGHHFVIHQHDHPISGVHYDLRLQISGSSTCSWAIPYGVPGNPNSARPNRMAIETRIHNLWNNLIESASHATGSLLIWDTGEYEVLDRPQQGTAPMTDDEPSDFDEEGQHLEPQNERLVKAFRSRHIHLRLHGQRLPAGYTIALRLPRQDAQKRPRRSKIKRRRVDPAKAAQMKRFESAQEDTASSSDEAQTGASSVLDAGDMDEATLASEAENEEQDAEIRANNAYPGATNNIGSVHQRHWFLTLDRKNSGFVKARSGIDEGRWVGGFEPFFVRGRDVERSVVTGRSAEEIMADEGVEGYQLRKMWMPILE